MSKHTPEDQFLLDLSSELRRAAYGEDEPEIYPFLGLQVFCWISGLISGGGLVWIFMR